MKISVVVPTYNTDQEALSRLIGSIDKQTMAKDEYELVFIDDGSTTDTFERLKELQSTRSNMIVKQIPNSGWGSRPRNIGTKMATGEYVLYLDHDDVVYPEAFERVYDYGKKHHADVINPKEVRTNGWSWGWEQFKENNPSAEKLGISSLLPMTPHKFYRRQFLLDNGIEFNEGARVLWEDVYFNTKVFTCGAKVAILADYPTYYWITTGANNSSSFGRDPHEKWAQIRKLIAFFTETITNKADLEFMLTHWYQTRLLGILGQWLLKNKDDRIAIEFDYAQRLASEFIPLAIDRNLTPVNQTRAYFLRGGNIEGLKKLAEHDKKLTARSYANEIKWLDGKLSIDAEAEMTIDESSPYLVHQNNGNLMRDVPANLESSIPANQLNVTEELYRATYEASIKGRDSRITWEVPADYAAVSTKPIEENNLKISGRLKVNIDIQHAAMGMSLEKQPWDVAARFSAIGYTFHRGIVAPKGFGAAALISGYTAVAYRNKSEILTIDLNSRVRSVVGTSKPTQSDLTYNRTTGLVLNLPNVHVSGVTKIKGKVELVSDEDVLIRVPAHLIGDEYGARVIADYKFPAGKYRITTIFEGRRTNTRLYVDIADEGIKGFLNKVKNS